MERKANERQKNNSHNKDVYRSLLRPAYMTSESFLVVEFNCCRVRMLAPLLVENPLGTALPTAEWLRAGGIYYSLPFLWWLYTGKLLFITLLLGGWIIQELQIAGCAPLCLHTNRSIHFLWSQMGKQTGTVTDNCFAPTEYVVDGALAKYYNRSYHIVKFCVKLAPSKLNTRFLEFPHTITVTKCIGLI